MEVAVDVDRAFRHGFERHVLQQQRRVAAGVERAVDLVEAVDIDFPDAIDLVVADDQELAPRRSAEPLESSAPQGGDRHVAEADDRVVRSDRPFPGGEERRAPSRSALAESGFGSCVDLMFKASIVSGGQKADSRSPIARRWHRRDETTKALVPEFTVSGRICCRRPRTPPRGSASPDASRRCRKEVCDEQGPRTGRKTGFFRTGWERPGINYLCSRCLDEHGRGTGPGCRWPATASSSDRSHRTPGRCQPRSRPARRRPRGNRPQGRLRHPVAAPQRPSSAGNPSSPGGSCAPSVFWNIANCV